MHFLTLRSPYDLETVIVLEGSEYYEFIHGKPIRSQGQSANEHLLFQLSSTASSRVTTPGHPAEITITSCSSGKYGIIGSVHKGRYGSRSNKYEYLKHSTDLKNENGMTAVALSNRTAFILLYLVDKDSLSIII